VAKRKRTTKPAARRRPARKKAAPKPPPIGEAVLGRVILLLASLQDRAAVAEACRSKLEIPDGQVDATIEEARRQITLAADYHRNQELGRAITRLNDCYERSLKIQDVKTALAAQKEINKLLDLYRPTDGPVDPDRETTHDQAVDELAEVRDHLAPLGLADDETSTVELARLAVAAICEHDARNSDKA